MDLIFLPFWQVHTVFRNSIRNNLMLIRQKVHLVKLDILSGEGADRLATLVHEKAKADRPCIFYLAVAPSLFGPSCQLLKSAGVVLPQSRLVVEKPLGHDYASAEAIGTELQAVFDEKQIYDLLKDKYGEWILYDPKFNKNTYFLWLLPILMFIIGGAIIFKLFIIKKN